MSLANLLNLWRANPQFMSQIAAWRTLPARPARYTPWPVELEPAVVAMAGRQGIDRPYSHQAAAIEATLRGENVVMVTATASGKTLGYNAAVLNTLLNDPTARALYLFPTKALARDQLFSLDNFLGSTDPGPTDLRIRPGAYDGDTPSSQRSKIRRTSRLILTNPDMVHAGLLPYHPRWQEFISGLRFVVLDELHTYRGVFGSHVANVLRRLERICRFYGASPQFICASATIANPQTLAEKLTGRLFTLIDQDGSPQTPKHILFFNPAVIDRVTGTRRSLTLSTQDLGSDLLSHEVQTIIFGRSRLTVEVLLGYLRDSAQRHKIDPNQVQAYRSGYLPSDRRAIEDQIRRGFVRTAVATTALELGIDIGGLAACLMAGYPGTIASTWQQAGRAGRRAGEALAVLVAGSGAIDQFLMNHPDYFFGRTPEHARIAPDNLAIRLAHLQCAAYELPLTSGEPFGQADNLQALLRFLSAEGLLRQRTGNWYWMGDGSPIQAVSLRSATAANVAIEAEAGNGPAVIGELDRPSVPLLLYEGAIYIQQGQTYQVTALDWAGGRATVRPVEVDYYTQAQTSTTVKILDVFAEERVGSTGRAHGQVLVTSQATGYRLIKRYSHETFGQGEIDLPAQEMETSAYWLTLTEETLERLRRASLWRLDRIRSYGPNWPDQRQAARARDGYRCRLCHAPETTQRQLDVHHLRPLRDFLLERSGDLTLVPTSVPAEVYQRANALSNLLTLCRACHRRVENTQRIGHAWSGLAHALSNLAPLFLMCSPRDIGTNTDTQPPAGQLPSISIYDQVPGGLGFSEQLYHLHSELLLAAHNLVEQCSCPAGCPACVGPVVEGETDPKEETKTLVTLLLTLPEV
jgi:DEAD/DEAH box helicase domain-containing protein